MGKKSIATLLALCLLWLSTDALATSTNPVLITGIRSDASSDPSSAVYIQFETRPNSSPDCAVETWALFDPSLSADSVAALKSLATAAYLAGKTVRVNWTGLCTHAKNGYGYINDIVMTSGT